MLPVIVLRVRSSEIRTYLPDADGRLSTNGCRVDCYPRRTVPNVRFLDHLRDGPAANLGRFEPFLAFQRASGEGWKAVGQR